MAILVGIDGTGEAVFGGEGRDKEYDIAFRNSFVRRICNGGGPLALYKRGPLALGNGLGSAIDEGFNHVVGKLTTFHQPVVLTGYSRGAAGVVALAAKLSKKNIPVHAIMLFDCVDRHLTIDAERIPENVQYVFHVMRDPAAKSRESFSNDGRLFTAGKTNYKEEKFLCTHGGMGGCPWKPGPGESPNDYISEGFGAGWYDGKTAVTYEQDARISNLLWNRVQPFLKEHGFYYFS